MSALIIVSRGKLSRKASIQGRVEPTFASKAARKSSRAAARHCGTFPPLSSPQTASCASIAANVAFASPTNFWSIGRLRSISSGSTSIRMVTGGRSSDQA